MSKRAAGEGTVRMLGVDRWEAAKMIDGRRVSRSGRTRREALERLDAATKNGATPRSKSNTVADAIAAHMKHLDARVAAGSLKPRTRDYYENVLTHAPLDMRLDKARPSDIEAWQAGLAEQGLSGSTRRGAYIALKSAFATARRDRMTSNDPFEGLQAPSGARESEPVHATTEDVQALLDAANEPWRTLWMVLAYTGLRRGEALALEWDDIDLDRAVLTVRSGKTARARRQVPLVPAVVEALAAMPRTGPCPFPFDGRNTLRAFYRHRPRAGLTIHSLRHGVATRLLEQGASVHVVSAILGHSSVSITLDNYSHSVAQAERDALGMLA